MTSINRSTATFHPHPVKSQEGTNVKVIIRGSLVNQLTDYGHSGLSIPPKSSTYVYEVTNEKVVITASKIYAFHSVDGGKYTRVYVGTSSFIVASKFEEVESLMDMLGQ